MATITESMKMYRAFMLYREFRYFLADEACIYYSAHFSNGFYNDGQREEYKYWCKQRDIWVDMKAPLYQN